MNLDGLLPWAGLAGAGPEEADIAVCGVAYEGSAVYRRGAAQGPAEIRRLSAACPPVGEDGTRFGFSLHDLGDFEMPDGVERGWPEVASRLSRLPPGVFLTSLGGDHCAAIPVLAAQAARHPRLAVAWIDAHPDLCDFSRGGAWTCGCALRRALDVAEVEAVGLAGVRDFDPEELDWIQSHQLLSVSAAAAVADPAAAGRALAEAAAGRPLHLSVDIDVLDPAFAPGTEVASPGGLSTRQLLELLGSLAGANLVGLDVVEVSPPLDHSDITSLAALKIVFETWGMVWKARR